MYFWEEAMISSEQDNIYWGSLHTACKDIPRGRKQKARLPVPGNEQEWLFRPGCRKRDAPLPGTRSQFAVVTSLARPDADTAEAVLYELICLRFEPTSPFGSQFPLRYAHTI